MEVPGYYLLLPVCFEMVPFKSKSLLADIVHVYRKKKPEKKPKPI